MAALYLSARRKTAQPAIRVIIESRKAVAKEASRCLLRLERARDMRERTDNSDPSVTEAALACGFQLNFKADMHYQLPRSEFLGTSPDDTVKAVVDETTAPIVRMPPFE